MIFYKSVLGTQGNINPTEIDNDNVYIRNNIERIENDDFVGWKYDEIVYSKNEYIQLIAEQNQSLEKQLSDTQAVIYEIYQNIGGVNNGE